ncbi:14653_t:CDS:2, partial [Gigaspora margarita]
MVGHWIKISKNWTIETNDKSKQLGSEQKAFFSEAKKKLYTWVFEQRKQALAITYKILHYKIDLAKEFKASYYWLTAFIKRNKLALCYCTKTSQKLSEQTQPLLQKFYQLINDLKMEKSYKLGNIFNMDEIPIWFDMS